jgi:hypothetical protein
LLALTAVVIFALVIGGELSGLNLMRNHPSSGQDYFPAVEFVAAHHTPGEPIIVAYPPPAYIALGSKDDLIFVSGTLDRERAQVYARRLNNGEYADYWIGAPSIVTTGQLCQALLSSPSAWLIVDRARLRADWAYKGDMATVMLGLTRDAEPDWPAGRALVRRLAPISKRDQDAVDICSEAMVREGFDEPRFEPLPR